MRVSNKRTVQALAKAVFGLLLLASVACTPGSSGSGGSAGTPPAPQGGQGPEQFGNNGTGDSTGADGIKGKAFEAYKVDITTLPEWNEWIVPIQDHFNSTKKDKDAQDSLSYLAKSKSWFFVPVKLNQIPKKRLGVDFVQDPIQQFALQTRKEVWVDQDLYDAAPTSRDRALILMHELVVSLYLQKFEPLREICLSLQANCDSKAVDLLENRKELAPEPRRVIDENDYPNIRAVTSALFEDFKKFNSREERDALLARYHFDTRFNKTTLASAKIEVAPSSKETLKVWIQNQIRLGLYPRILSKTFPRQSSEDVELKILEDPTHILQILQMTTSKDSTSFSSFADFAGPDIQFIDNLLFYSAEEAQTWPSVFSSSMVLFTDLKPGDYVPLFQYFLSVKPFFEAKKGEVAMLESMQIEAINIHFAKVIAVKKDSKNIKFTLGFVSPEEKPGFVLTRQKIPADSQTHSDISVGNPWDYEIPLDLVDKSAPRF